MMKMRMSIRGAMIAVVSLLATMNPSSPCVGDIITVCLNDSCDANTLAEAIAIAQDGDEIRMSADIFVTDATIVLDGRSLTIVGEAPNAGEAVTTISGGGLHRVLELRGGASVEFRSLIATDGLALPPAKGKGDDPHAGWGGWLHVEDGTAEFVNCVLRRNTAGNGGAVSLYDGRLTATNCRFEHNTALNLGGVICAWGPGSFTLEDCTFEYNVAEVYAGAMLIADCGPSSIARSRFRLNSAGEIGDGTGTPGTCWGGGGAIASNSNVLTIDDCDFESNLGGIWGGALYHAGSSPITNCRFVENIALVGGAIGCDLIAQTMPTEPLVIDGGAFTSNSGLLYGGAVGAVQLRSLEIRNSTFEGHASPRGATIWAGGNRTGSLTVHNSVFEACCVIEPGHKVTDLGGNLWNNTTFGVCPECRADVSCSGDVDAMDLSMLLTGWGGSSPSLDLDEDGTVGPGDLAILFAMWGTCG